MKKNLKQITLMFALIIGFLPNIYAWGTFNFNRMDLGNNVTSGIPPLQSTEGNLNNSQIRSIMGSFFTSGTENFGYYTIELSSTRIGYGPRHNAIEAAYIAAGVITLFIGMPFLPCGQNRFSLFASIVFYDINNRKIAEFTDSTIYDGLEYIQSSSHRNNDHTYKTEHLFKNLLRNCLNAASRDADNINRLLIEAKYPQATIATVAKNAFDELKRRIPPCSEISCSRIAVINVNKNTDVIAASLQIEHLFLNTNGYHIVDRRTIEHIITEIIFSDSEFVSDSNAINIGRMVSANYLIIVDIAGEGINRVLNFRAVFVETGVVIASFNSRFRS